MSLPHRTARRTIEPQDALTFAHVCPVCKSIASVYSTGGSLNVFDEPNDALCRCGWTGKGDELLLLLTDSRHGDTVVCKPIEYGGPRSSFFKEGKE